MSTVLKVESTDPQCSLMQRLAYRGCSKDEKGKCLFKKNPSLVYKSYANLTDENALGSKLANDLVVSFEHFDVYLDKQQT